MAVRRSVPPRAIAMLTPTSGRAGPHPARAPRGPGQAAPPAAAETGRSSGPGRPPSGPAGAAVPALAAAGASSSRAASSAAALPSTSPSERGDALLRNRIFDGAVQTAWDAAWEAARNAELEWDAARSAAKAKEQS